MVEAAELAEHFQWLSGSESKHLGKKARAQVEGEIADVFLYLIRLADKLRVDLFKVANRKIDVNGIKYPANRVRGSAKKYSEYK